MKLIVISNPDNIKNEIDYIVKLLENGLEYFHLRKPGITKGKLIRLIEKIPKEYHNRIIIYDHFELIMEYKLYGIHFNRRTIKSYGKFKHYHCHKSYSAHKLEELLTYDGQFDYMFISPVYDSISKNSYKANIDVSELKRLFDQGRIQSEIIALGGITTEKIQELKDVGFSGIAVLGTIWNKCIENNDFNIALSVFKELKKGVKKGRPFVLSIAGFDPSSGAGLSADIKTMENFEVYGISACSAITYQNDDEFVGVDWLCKGKIIQQIDVLLKKYIVDYVKIGVIESFEVLSQIVEHLINRKPGIKIIWDPVIKSSTGFDFHKNFDEETFLSVLKKIYLITPNKEEFDLLFKDVMKINDYIRQNETCSILLKGVRSSKNEINDILFNGEEEFDLRGEQYDNVEKHGSGCVLSSAITSLLAHGNDLRQSCLNAKQYAEKYLLSTNTKIGYHNGGE